MADENNKEEVVEEKKEEATESAEAKESGDSGDSADSASTAKAEEKTEVKTSRESDSTARRTDRPRREGGRGDSRGGRHDQGRSTRFRRKVCRFCHDKDLAIDYKKPEILERFITDRGKILPRRVTGTCSRHQRALSRAIKRARIIAFLPFVEQ
jgi:small subunit ribosomal protein S18